MTVIPEINRYVGVKEEATFGTEAAVPMAFDLKDGMGAMALDVPNDPNIVIPTLSRFQQRHAPGFYSPAGALDYVADVNTVGWFLKWMLGGYVFTEGAAGEPNVHEFYPTPGHELPSFTTRVGKDTFEHVFLGCIINKIKLSVDKDLLSGSLDMIAQQDKKAALRSTLNEPDPDIFPMAFYNHTVKLGGVDISQYVTAWELDHDNGIKAEDGQGMGSRFPYRFRPSDAKIGVTLTMWDDDSSKLEAFWGSANGPGYDPQDDFVLEDDFDSGDFGNMKVKFPKAYYQKLPTDIKGSDPRKPAIGIGVEATEITLHDGTTHINSPFIITIENYQDEYALPTTP